MRDPRPLTLALVALLLLGLAPRRDRPRVLFLGDSVHQRMVDAAAKALTDALTIERPQRPAFDSGSALERIDELLGDGDWDLVYFNFGLGDLFYKDPRTREIRALSKDAGGVRVSAPEQYAHNLDRLVRRLQQTGAQLVWASTTPLVNVNAFPRFTHNLYDAGSEVEYNRLAAAVMQRHGVAIHDVHAHVLSQFEPDEKHPAFDQYDKALQKKSPLHEVVVRVLRETLLDGSKP